MIFKRLILSLVVIFGMSTAQASTLSNLEVDPTGPTGSTGFGPLNDTPAGLTFFAQGRFNSADHRFIVSPAGSGQFLAFPMLGGPAALAGNLLEEVREVGQIRQLYRTVSGTLAPDFGSFFIAQFITNSAGDAASLTVFSTRPVATPIPLPAGAVLLISGLGGLAIARRRKKAAR